MKKLTFPVALLALFLSALSLFQNSSSSKQVYVDVNKLLEGYERTKSERLKFEAKSVNLKANVDTLLTQWQDELKAYEKERASLSKRELELRQELMVNRQQQINNYQEAVQKQIKEENTKMTQTVINDINDYVKSFGEENGYTIIFGAVGGGNIMYADDVSDLTNEVLEGLNSEYTGK